MLRKLMKHELRATARLMLPLYLVVLLLAVGARFSVTWFLDASTGNRTMNFILDLLGGLMIVGFAVGLVAVFVVALVLMILRFRSNLLGDEGYVMFTLPVSTHQLVWSKLIVSTVWFAGAALVDALALVILAINSAFFTNLGEIFYRVLEKFTAYYAVNGVLMVAELLLLCVMVAINLCLEFYTPLSIGHSFDRHKMFLSVVFFFVIQAVGQFVGGTLLFASAPALDAVSGFMDTLPPEMVLHGGLWFAILATVVYSAVLYVINHLMLSRKLNLE